VGVPPGLQPTTGSVGIAGGDRPFVTHVEHNVVSSFGQNVNTLDQNVMSSIGQNVMNPGLSQNVSVGQNAQMTELGQNAPLTDMGQKADMTGLSKKVAIPNVVGPYCESSGPVFHHPGQSQLPEAILPRNAHGLAESMSAPPALAPIGGAPFTVSPLSVMLAPMPGQLGAQTGNVNAINGSHQSFSHSIPPQPQLPQLMPISCHPAVFASMNTPLPKFKGDPHAWPEWKRKWQERVGFMHASGPLDDRILVSQFSESMDAVTKRIIEARRAENPNLTFGEIFKEIDAKFTKSAKNTSRGKLENLCLKSMVGNRLTMRDYENVDAEFRILRSECPEVGNNEAKRLFQSALPTFLIESLQKELLKKEKNPRAIFVGQNGFAPYQVKTWLDQTLATTFVRVGQDQNGFLVHCQDQSQLGLLLQLDGRTTMTGERILVRPVDPQLTLDEMRQICRETLQPRENAQEIKSQGAPASQRQAQRPSQVPVLSQDDIESACDRDKRVGSGCHLFPWPREVQGCQGILQ